VELEIYLVNILLKYKADINSRNKDLVEYLVEHGAEINKENKDGETPLFIHSLMEIKI